MHTFDTAFREMEQVIPAEWNRSATAVSEYWNTVLSVKKPTERVTALGDVAMLPFLLGDDASGKVAIGDLAGIGNLLIGGDVDSGKTALLHTIAISLMLMRSGALAKFAFVDMDGGGFSSYDDLPNVLRPVSRTFDEVQSLVHDECVEMAKRRRLFSAARASTVAEYNVRESKQLACHVLVVDEISPYTEASRKADRDELALLCRFGPEYGIYTVLATRTITKKALPDDLTASFESRIALRLKNARQSKFVVGEDGAESLSPTGTFCWKTVRRLYRSIEVPARSRRALISSIFDPLQITERKRVAVSCREASERKRMCAHNEEQSRKLFAAGKWAKAIGLARKTELTDPELQYWLGRCFECGNAVDVDLKEAFLWYSKSADQGNARAEYAVGSFYRKGMFVGKDDAVALQWFLKSATGGLASGQLMAGLFYERGIGAASDASEAFKWFKAGAAQDNAHAQWRLATCYRYGRGVAQSLSDACAWYERSVSNGCDGACVGLAQMYENGEHVAVDLLKAKSLVDPVAKKRDGSAASSAAMEAVTRLSAKMFAIEADACEAFAAGRTEDGLALADKTEKHSPRLLYYLGRCSLEGACVEVDAEKAVRFLSDAAEGNDADAALLMGDCCRNGIGCGQDLEKAYFWYEKSSWGGNVIGQRKQGECFLDGIGVEQDVRKAVECLQNASHRDDACASFLLARLYHYGRGVDRDIDAARSFYEKAVSGGVEEARPGLADVVAERDLLDHQDAAKVAFVEGRISDGVDLCRGYDIVDAEVLYRLGRAYYDHDNGVSDDPSLAFRFFSKAASSANVDAMYYMGYCCEQGIVAVQDVTMALEWYRKASDCGAGLAQYRLGRLYAEGRGVARDVARAAEMFAAASEKSVADAQYRLAVCCQTGEGIAQDDVRAHGLLAESVKDGEKTRDYLSESYLRYANCLMEGRGCPADRTAACEWFEKASRTAFAEGKASVGVEAAEKTEGSRPELLAFVARCFEHGGTVVRSLRKARRFYEKALDAGYDVCRADYARVSDACRLILTIRDDGRIQDPDKPLEISRRVLADEFRSAAASCGCTPHGSETDDLGRMSVGAETESVAVWDDVGRCYSRLPVEWRERKCIEACALVGMAASALQGRCEVKSGLYACVSKYSTIDRLDGFAEALFHGCAGFDPAVVARSFAAHAWGDFLDNEQNVLDDAERRREYGVKAGAAAVEIGYEVGCRMARMMEGGGGVL